MSLGLITLFGMMWVCGADFASGADYTAYQEAHTEFSPDFCDG